MSTYARTPENGIGTTDGGQDIDELIDAHDPTYIGTDGSGADHYWSIYEQTAYVVENDDVKAWPLEETPLQTLGNWVDHVASQRGEWQELRVDRGDVVDHLVAALEAGDYGVVPLGEEDE